MLTSRALIATLICLAASSALPTDSLAQRDRRMPPEQVRCERDQLTSYTGVITAVEASEDNTRITLETDWDTLETVDVAEAKGLKPGMRITAWVCSDCETPPYIQRLPD